MSPILVRLEEVDSALWTVPFCGERAAVTINADRVSLVAAFS